MITCSGYTLSSPSPNPSVALLDKNSVLQLLIDEDAPICSPSVEFSANVIGNRLRIMKRRVEQVKCGVSFVVFGGGYEVGSLQKHEAGIIRYLKACRRIPLTLREYWKNREPGATRSNGFPDPQR